ncbi:MAG TPA: hypothetical protein VFB89_13225 [Gemmatimonadales bacterium]|nr:hypothetical protein [Gemmatimonadales bacterium]
MSIRIEWWRDGRRIGWRSYRVTSYLFYDQYSRGPFGPYAYCTRWL